MKTIRPAVPTPKVPPPTFWLAFAAVAAYVSIHFAARGDWWDAADGLLAVTLSAYIVLLTLALQRRADTDTPQVDVSAPPDPAECPSVSDCRDPDGCGAPAVCVPPGPQPLTNDGPPEVLQHFLAAGSPRSGGVRLSVCGKVWPPIPYSKVAGRCPTCVVLVEAGWMIS